MAEQIITLAEARAQGLSHYMTGRPCKSGHISRRAVSNNSCLECDNIRSKRYQSKNPEKVKATRKARYHKDPEGKRQKVKAYRDANRDLVREQGRARYQKPEVKEYQRAYREKHKERRNELIAQWQRDNREKRIEQNRRWYYKDLDHSRAVHLEKEHRRRAQKLGAEGSHTKEELALLLEKQGHRCAYCRANLRKVKKHADHIFPLSLGGSNSIDNIQWLCATCNLSKSAKDPIAFAQERGLLL